MGKVIVAKTSGNFDGLQAYLENADGGKAVRNTLEKFGKLGCESLKHHTPKDTGKTAESWEYEVEPNSAGMSVVWYNTNETKYQNNPVVTLLTNGHVVRNRKGGPIYAYVEGRPFIEEAMDPILSEIADEVWKELKPK